jgi:hypothetical protein
VHACIYVCVYTFVYVYICFIGPTEAQEGVLRLGRIKRDISLALIKRYVLMNVSLVTHIFMNMFMLILYAHIFTHTYIVLFMDIHIFMYICTIVDVMYV